MKILLTLFVIFFTINAEAQLFIDRPLLDTVAYKSCVKLVDEFFLRFNCEEYNSFVDSTAEHHKTMNILTLFDAQMFKVMNSNADTVFRKAAEFALDIESNCYKIHYEDTSWFAVADCHAKLTSKPVVFKIYLSVEHRIKNRYKWVIDRVEGDIFQLLPKNQDESFIMPDAHEINFMPLSDITANNYGDIVKFGNKNTEIDQTTVFYTLVARGQLKIEYLSDMQFVFLQVPGYKFSIREFVRETNNSGWLIDHLEKMSDTQKNKILNYVYLRK